MLDHCTNTCKIYQTKVSENRLIYESLASAIQNTSGIYCMNPMKELIIYIKDPVIQYTCIGQYSTVQYIHTFTHMYPQ